ncbi:hypothetical protein OHA02_17255 [Streptomyces phaeochromogenes]|nr:hypothetical protein [Streptomyces phaeochromogenes]
MSTDSTRTWIRRTSTAAGLAYTAIAEYELARRLGAQEPIAVMLPLSLDCYVVAALKWFRAFDVALSLILMCAAQVAAHALDAGVVKVTLELVTVVSVLVPVALWRTHALAREDGATLPDGVAPEPSAARTELAPEPVPVKAEPAEPITVERGEFSPVAAPEPVRDMQMNNVLGPWTPLAELAAGTGGTVIDLRLPKGYRAAGPLGGTGAEPAPEPVPPVVPVSVTDTGTGAADIASEDTGNTTFEARVALVRTWLTLEPELTGTDIGERLGKSDGYGRRVLRTARDGS